MSVFSDKQPTANELQQVVAYILGTDAIVATITSLIEGEIDEFAGEMQGVEKRFPGYTKRLRRKISKEVERIVCQKVPDLQQKFEDFLSSHLTPDDITAALRFQRHQISGQLRDPGFIRLLKTSDSSDIRLSERMSAHMSSRQHAFVSAFLQSPAGLKLFPLTRQMESLKYGWMQEIATDISQRLPAIGNGILHKYYIR